MAYPWPSFSTFTFKATEKPVFGTDSGWVQMPNIARQPVLGGVADTVITLSAGSAERSFSVYLSNPRVAELAALLGRPGSFCDWARPVPDSRPATLVSLQPGEEVYSGNADGQQDSAGRPLSVRRLCEVRFASQ